MNHYTDFAEISNLADIIQSKRNNLSDYQALTLALEIWKTGQIEQALNEISQTIENQ